MHRRTLLLLILLGSIAVVTFLVYTLLTSPMTDEKRLKEMTVAQTTLHRIESGKITVSDQIAGAFHLTKPHSYYREQYLAHKTALIASRYLVETNLPVSNLWERIAQIVPRVDKARKKEFLDATFDYQRNLVTFLCRTPDVSFWESTFNTGSVSSDSNFTNP